MGYRGDLTINLVITDAHHRRRPGVPRALRHSLRLRRRTAVRACRRTRGSSSTVTAALLVGRHAGHPAPSSGAIPKTLGPLPRRREAAGGLLPGRHAAHGGLQHDRHRRHDGAGAVPHHRADVHRRVARRHGRRRQDDDVRRRSVAAIWATVRGRPGRRRVQAAPRRGHSCTRAFAVCADRVPGGQRRGLGSCWSSRAATCCTRCSRPRRPSAPSGCRWAGPAACWRCRAFFGAGGQAAHHGHDVHGPRRAADRWPLALAGRSRAAAHPVSRRKGDDRLMVRTIIRSHRPRPVRLGHGRDAHRNGPGRHRHRRHAEPTSRRWPTSHPVRRRNSTPPTNAPCGSRASRTWTWRSSPSARTSRPACSSSCS